MPIIDFDNSKKNTSTSRFLVYYLEKENKDKTTDEKELFFDLEKEYEDPEKIIETLDNNKSKLGAKEDKYYSIYIAPSEKELQHISGDKDKLKEYTKNLVDIYAKNFNKNLDKSDILFFAKVEEQRHWKNKDSEVKNGFVKQGELKSGDNTHIHLVVSRKTKSKWYKGEKIIDGNGKILVNDPNLIKRANTLKISPNDSSRGGDNFKVGGRTISRGFNRVEFKIKGEKLFDKSFSYKRDLSESFEYVNLKKNHPDLFLEKYGKQQMITNKLSYGELETTTEKEKYIKKVIDKKIHFHKNDKAGFDKVLKEKGISSSKNGFHLKNSFISNNDMLKGVGETSKTLFLAMYVTSLIKKTSKEIEGSQKKQNDKEQQNDKEL